MTERKISKEEEAFGWYLEELQKEGIILRYEHHPKTFELIPAVKCYYYDESARKNKFKEKHWLYNDTYTPDYLIVWNQDYLNKAYCFIATNKLCLLMAEYYINPSLMFFIANEYESSYENDTTEHRTWIDVKGTFAGKNNLSASTFPIKQKMMMHLHGIYVQKIVIPEFFKTTFTPEKYRIPIRRSTGQEHFKRISVRLFKDLLDQNLF